MGITLSGKGATSRVEDVEEWGGKVEVRSCSVRDRGRLMTLQTGIFDPPEGMTSGDCFVAYQIALLIATCRDPSTGEFCFTDDDVEKLYDEDAQVIARVVKVAAQVCGFNTTAAEDLGKDSSTTESDDTSSS